VRTHSGPARLTGPALKCARIEAEVSQIGMSMQGKIGFGEVVGTRQQYNIEALRYTGRVKECTFEIVEHGRRNQAPALNVRLRCDWNALRAAAWGG
jgi:hypothetical protein